MSRAMGILLCSCLLAALPAAVAAAKGPPREPDEGPDPRGLTLSGTGIASALAAAVGLTLGPVVVVTERNQGIEQGYVAPERYCLRSRRGTRRLRCRVPRATSTTVAVTFASAQTSAAVSTRRALVVPGIATVPVLPEDRRSSPSILRALVAAQDAATPAAIAAGRLAARTTAAAAGLPRGALAAVAELRRPYEDSYAGSFGPGRFCGVARRAIVRRDPDTGRRRVVRRVRRRSCFFPREVSAGLRLTYVR